MYILDVGWYRNEYALFVTKNYDWENPLIEKCCVDLDKQNLLLKECSEHARKILSY